MNTIIELFSPELLFLGKTGQPYRGSVIVKYRHSENSIDMLAFKRFITSLRSTTLLFEDVPMTINEWIANNLKTTTDKIFVSVQLTARGGIQSNSYCGDDTLNVNIQHDKKLIFQIGE